MFPVSAIFDGEEVGISRGVIESEERNARRRTWHGSQRRRDHEAQLHSMPLTLLEKLADESRKVRIVEPFDGGLAGPNLFNLLLKSRRIIPRLRTPRRVAVP